MRLELDNTVELSDFVFSQFSSPGGAFYSEGNVALLNDKKPSFFSDRTCFVPLMSPLKCVNFALAFNDKRQYSIALRFFALDSSDLGYMRRKMVNRLGRHWVPASPKLEDPRGFYLDKNGEPIATVNSNDNLSEFIIGVGCQGSQSMFFSKEEDFFSGVGTLEKVGNAFFDSCYATRNFYNPIRMPKCIHIDCGLNFYA